MRIVISSVMLVAMGCGGGGNKKPPEEPVAKMEAAKPLPPPETEADREHKRHAAALAIVPENSTCLPAALKDNGAPRLDLAVVGTDAILCAVDTDHTRLLGPIACWQAELPAGTLTYQAPKLLPGHDIDVKLDDRCARGYCMPKDAKLPDDKVAHMAWSLDGNKVAVLAGDEVHLFDTASKEHQTGFSIRGDKGVVGDPSAVHFVSDTVLVEAGDPTTGGVWVFKGDGTAIGPITAIGAKETDKPLTTFKGSFSILDKNRVAIAERGFSTVTVYELDTGKRPSPSARSTSRAARPTRSMLTGRTATR